MRWPAFLSGAERRAEVRQKRGQRRAERARLKARHQERMYSAAGVSSVALRCHRDTWDRILDMMKTQGDWRAPSGDSLKPLTNQMVEVSISGSNFVALLFKSSFVASGALYEGDRVFAHRVYSAFAQVADRIDPAARGRPLPPVVLDDQAASFKSTP